MLAAHLAVHVCWPSHHKPELMELLRVFVTKIILVVGSLVRFNLPKVGLLCLLLHEQLLNHLHLLFMEILLLPPGH